MIYENGKKLKDSIFTERTHVDSAIIDLDTITYNRIHQNTFETVDEGYTRVEAKIPALRNTNEISVDTLVETLKKENYLIAKNPFVPKDDNERKERCEKILKIQAMAWQRVCVQHIFIISSLVFLVDWTAH